MLTDVAASVSFAPLNATARAAAIAQANELSAALKEITPGMGAYVNEVGCKISGANSDNKGAMLTRWKRRHQSTSQTGKRPFGAPTTTGFSRLSERLIRTMCFGVHRVWAARGGRRWMVGCVGFDLPTPLCA